MKREIPPFLSELLASPPRAGGGVHDWLFRTARHLHTHLPAGEIIDLLQNRVARCGRYVSRKEIEDAVKNSIGCAWQPNQSATAKPGYPKWPGVNRERREAIIQAGGGLADLWELSPIRIEDSRPRTEQIIDLFFPGNPFLCCGQSKSNFDTRPREQWRGEMSRLAHIVPSQMTGRTGMTKDGKESAHSLNNTGQRRFLVVEFDTGTTDEQAAVLIHLARLVPLVCVVHSGGKSLHGWFYCHRAPEKKVMKFFRYAVCLGADRATWTRSQFVRMPDGTRDDGKRQTVYFLDTEPLEPRR